MDKQSLRCKALELAVQSRSPMDKTQDIIAKGAAFYEFLDAPGATPMASPIPKPLGRGGQSKD